VYNSKIPTWLYLKMRKYCPHGSIENPRRDAALDEEIIYSNNTSNIAYPGYKEFPRYVPNTSKNIKQTDNS